MEAVKFGFDDVLADCLTLVRENFALVAWSMLAIVAAYTLVDQISTSATSVPNLVVGIVGQYAFVERLLKNRLPPGERHRRYGAIFLASLLAGLATLVGFVLLIVPGLILLAGWSASTPFIVVEDMSGTEALAASWHATAASRWALVLVFAVYSVAFVAALAGIVFAVDAVGVAGGIGESLITNFTAALMSLGSWIVGAAVYRLAVPDSGELESVFA